MKSPVFIFSLPRSGSTLLQRILSGHSEIATIAEPWLILPYIYSSKIEGVITEYSHYSAYLALEDFYKNLPNKYEDYYNELRKFIFNLYEKQCHNDELYFLDKTPRYYLIIPEILNLFPDAKFIFLFRNPVHVFASLMSTWGNNGFGQLYKNYVDIEEGPVLLAQGYELMKDKAIAVNYEQLVTEPKKVIHDILNYLELNFSEDLINKENFQDIKGKKGDPYSRNSYAKIQTLSLDKWKKSFNTAFRKKILRNYINSIDQQCFELQGYNKFKILNEIKEIETSFDLNIFKDIFNFYKSKLIKTYNITLPLSKKTKWSKGKFLS